jgi:hypothetical protein
MNPDLKVGAGETAQEAVGLSQEDLEWFKKGLRENPPLILSPRDAVAFATAPENPGEPNEALRELMARRLSR